MLGDKIKMIDFGNCRPINEIDNQIQTRYYRSPEVIIEGEINETCDVWSLGCIYYELLKGKTLFDPEKNPRANRDRTHLFEVVSLLGPVPEELTKHSDRYSFFFQKSGQ